MANWCFAGMYIHPYTYVYICVWFVICALGNTDSKMPRIRTLTQNPLKNLLALVGIWLCQKGMDFQLIVDLKSKTYNGRQTNFNRVKENRRVLHIEKIPNKLSVDRRQWTGILYTEVLDSVSIDKRPQIGLLYPKEVCQVIYSRGPMTGPLWSADL